MEGRPSIECRRTADQRRFHARRDLGVRLVDGLETQRRIVFDNRCNAPIRLLVRHADGYRNWHIHGWYDLDPHEVTGLTSNGTRLTQSDNHTLYFYAESSDNRGYLWNGDHNEEWRGTTYGSCVAARVAAATMLRTGIDTCAGPLRRGNPGAPAGAEGHRHAQPATGRCSSACASHSTGVAMRQSGRAPADFGSVVTARARRRG